VTAPWTPERAADVRGHLERYAAAEGHLRAELAVALMRLLPEALNEIERMRVEARRDLIWREAARVEVGDEIWDQISRRFLSMADGLDLATLSDGTRQVSVATLAARIAELEGLLSHTVCTIDIWNSADADGDEMEQVLVDTSGMLKTALGGDPAKDARDQPEILRHIPERAK
jgi:hypothetical protein